MHFKSFKFLIRIFRQWKKITKSDRSYIPLYRIVKIEKHEDGIYYVLVQLIGKNSLLKSEPEKLLADDKLVNSFSPTDIRTLTYLGYLGINSPKYKVLAKQLSEKNDQTLFAIHKKGEKTYQVITAEEISKNQEIINGLTQKEAHMIGFSTAIEQSIIEKREKENILNQLQKRPPPKDAA